MRLVLTVIFWALVGTLFGILCVLFGTFMVGFVAGLFS